MRLNVAGWARLGLVGFLTAFSGTYLIAVTGNFGFLAPVLAKQSPAVLDSINQYSPVVIINGLAASLVHDRLCPVRHCHDQDRDTVSLGRRAGRGGCSGPPAGFRDSSACRDRRLADRDLGSVCLGAGLGWAGYRLWQTPTASDVACFR